MDDITGWQNCSRINSYSYKCGYCGNKVGSDKGYCNAFSNDVCIYICPLCSKPTYVEFGDMVPGPTYGRQINNLPKDVEDIYGEARNSYKVGAYTGVVLLCRKLLANVAIGFGAKENKPFGFYVDYLVDNNYVAKNNKQWVDKIRTEGNSATHDKISKTKEEAKTILNFTQMLLITNYEFLEEVDNK
ncbi:DUF4145 domain-containing protein [Lactobacillus sp. ESL0680]|uniref:DUF4145 domain-containing protein n=1 Tax=Lactobacillus sp. ESL0680 TaxID=2983210 RepID=UPI0023F6619F|nr:DUF4145 domain-containing protein [Lactobacillus sp. ESL0680]WEV39265.1 DUF4145 domain-containing protein [Lactobacillus sp. ESL0680]